MGGISGHIYIGYIWAVGVLRSLGKHQQSKDRTFLHRSCTQLFFSTPKKKLFEIENVFQKKS